MSLAPTMDFDVIRRAVAGAATALVEETVVDYPPRCHRCNRALAEYLARPWSLRCRHCRAYNKSGPPPVRNE